MKPECWKDIPNYEGMYEASTWCDRSYNQTYSGGPNLVATNGREVYHIKGVRATAELIGVSLCSVQRMLRGEHKSVKGWGVCHKSLN